MGFKLPVSDVCKYKAANFNVPCAFRFYLLLEIGRFCGDQGDICEYEMALGV